MNMIQSQEHLAFRDSARSSVAVCWQARKLATSLAENMVSIAYTGESILGSAQVLDPATVLEGAIVMGSAYS